MGDDLGIHFLGECFGLLVDYISEDHSKELPDPNNHMVVTIANHTKQDWSLAEFQATQVSSVSCTGFDKNAKLWLGCHRSAQRHRNIPRVPPLTASCCDGSSTCPEIFLPLTAQSDSSQGRTRGNPPYPAQDLPAGKATSLYVTTHAGNVDGAFAFHLWYKVKGSDQQVIYMDWTVPQMYHLYSAEWENGYRMDKFPGFKYSFGEGTDMPKGVQRIKATIIVENGKWLACWPKSGILDVLTAF